MKHTTQLPTKIPAALNHLRGTTAKATLVATFVALALAGCGGNKDDEEAAPVASAPAAAATVVAAPAITVQPANLTVTELQPASFSVTATGEAPLTYEWRRNGTPVAGATSATLTIPAALAADHNAKYSVVVSNNAGSVASADAVLTEELPMFLMAGQSNMEGNVDSPLFQQMLADLASGTDAETTKSNLAARIKAWTNVPGRNYGYSDPMAALEASELVRLNAAGLVGANLTTPNPKVFCSWNESAIIPLTATPADTKTRCSNTAGPELVFGQALSKAGYSTTSLIKVAVGGTSLYDDWRSPLMGGETSANSKLLYAKLRTRIQSLKSNPTSVNPACKARACKWSAFVWFQGEQDVFSAVQRAAYEQNLKNFIADVRADVGSPDLPVVIVQIGSWAQSIDGYKGKIVSDAQTAVVNADKYARIVNTADLNGFYHYDPAAQLIIGERVSLAVQSLLAAAPAQK